MKKLLLSLATLLCGVTAWAEVLPTQELKASSNLPTGTPEYQFYVRQTKSEGQYWKPSTAPTNDKGQAGKFAFYAVPGLTNCYYIYNVDEQKWVNYSDASVSYSGSTESTVNKTDFVSLADNFNANAYWEITGSTMTGSTASCYQMHPTKNINRVADNKGINANINTNAYANWYEGSSVHPTSTLGLWRQGPADDNGSAWSLEPVDADNSILMAQEIALSKSILEAEGYSYTKGSDIITTVNVATILSSPYTDSSEGSIANLADGNAANFWHSNWHGGEVLNGSHYLVADISSTITESNPVPERLSFTYTRRSNAGADKTIRLAVYGVPTDDTSVAEDSRDGLTVLAVVSMPTSSNPYENTFQTKGFTKFRFYSEATSNNRGYFHIGDFQLNPMTEADDNAENLKTLAAALATAETKTSPTQEDIDALKAENAKFIASETARADAQALLNQTGVGYPSATAEARINLANALGSLGVFPEVLETLVTAYRNSTDIDLPEEGKVYTFANYSLYNGGTRRYLKYTSGQALATSTTESDAAQFLCKKLSDDIFLFITEDGKVMTWKGSKDGYTGESSKGYSNNYGPKQNDLRDWNHIALSKHINGNRQDAQFGTIQMIGRRAANGNTEKSSFIIKGSTGAWDQAGTTTFFGNDANCYSSAWFITECEGVAANEAQLLAVEKIDAKTDVAYLGRELGEGLGKYHYTENSTDTYTLTDAADAAINEATTTTAVQNAAKAQRQINLPAAKGFYRIAYDYGGTKGIKYLQGTASSVKGVQYSSDKEAASIFYFDNARLLSYTAGKYMKEVDNDRGLQGVGVDGGEVTFAGSPRAAGKYTIRLTSYLHANSDTNGDFSDHCSGDGCAQHDHIVEAVTSLPVTISAVGYATMYSPVALTLPEDGTLKAYYVTATISATATMTEITDGVIPAETGVILEGEAGTYQLTIAGTAEANADNKLTGTVASAYVADDAYVLSAPDNMVGLYRATKNQVNNTKFLNNGFKAYLSASEVAEQGVRFFRFDFNGGTETGIEDINAGNADADAVIYDLSGRRVNATQHGIYIINGKKVIK